MDIIQLHKLAWIFVLISLIGNFFIIKKSIMGFWFWLIADLFFIFLNFYLHETAQGVLYIIYTIFCLYGIYKWRKNESS